MINLYILDDGIEILKCSITEHLLNKNNLVELDRFLSYYDQNYKIYCSVEQNIDHICEEMKCLRKHIIDANINKNQ